VLVAKFVPGVGTVATITYEVADGAAAAGQTYLREKANEIRDFLRDADPTEENLRKVKEMITEVSDGEERKLLEEQLAKAEISTMIFTPVAAEKSKPAKVQQDVSQETVVTQQGVPQAAASSGGKPKPS